jgi:hypothetical protein
MTVHKLSRIFTIASFSLIFIGLAPADTIVLNDGTELEGTITEETAEYVKITVQVTANIRDPKMIKRADIKQVIKLTPDEIAYEKIKGLGKTDDLLNTTDYDSMLKTQIDTFLSQFPNSPLKGEVEKIKMTLEEEKAKVGEGAVKLNGEWISGDKIAADPFNHESKVLASKLAKEVDAGEFIEALSDFEVLKKDYEQSIGYAMSIGQAKKAAESLDAKLNAMKRESEFKVAKRAKEVAGMQAAARISTENAFKAQMDAFQKMRQEAKDAGDTWLPVDVWDTVSIDEAMKTLEAKSADIIKLDAAAETKKAALVEQVILALSAKDWAKAAAQVQLAQEAGVDSPKFKELSQLASESMKNAATLAKAEGDKAEQERMAQVRADKEKEIADRKETDANEKAAAGATAAAKKAAAKKKKSGESEEVEEEKVIVDTSSDDEFGDEVAAEPKKGIPLPLIIAIVGIMAAVSVFMIKNNKSRAEDDLNADPNDKD